MAQDFAKKRGKSRTTTNSSTRKRKASSKKKAEAPRVWRWYSWGVFTGILMCFMLYLVTLPMEPGANKEIPVANATAQPAKEDPPKPRFDFYTLLPEQTIDVEVDPGEIAKSRTSKKTELYLLQTGSFKQAEDADRRRAELLLLGLEPKIEETNGSNGHWYRVYVGPFESRSRLAKARSLTAAQNIDTLLLKRSKP
ncbi:MAG: SPOR domain-containing protein [Halioglobus sp.]